VSKDAGDGSTVPVWYVAYGSNLSAQRFAYYLTGGRPPGARRTYEGCRDASPPRRTAAAWLPGRLVFGGVSRAWGGGMAFYDPDGESRVAARGYRVTLAQFGDVLAQESRRPAGTPYALERAVDGRLPALGGAYDTVLHLGDADGAPRLALAATAVPAVRAPAAAYLRTILAGLADGFGLTEEERVDYLLEATGVRPRWDRDALHGLAREARDAAGGSFTPG
jgi:hypothetical protein